MEQDARSSATTASRLLVKPACAMLVLLKDSLNNVKDPLATLSKSHLRMVESAHVARLSVTLKPAPSSAIRDSQFKATQGDAQQDSYLGKSRLVSECHAWP